MLKHALLKPSFSTFNRFLSEQLKLTMNKRPAHELESRRCFVLLRGMAVVFFAGEENATVRFFDAA
jgi:hypothetical protein